MDKFKKSYHKFFLISKEQLEKSTHSKVGEVEIKNDLETLLSILPILEKKNTTISPEIDNHTVISMMKCINYSIFSFWFLRSDAVIKSVYNRLSETEKEEFILIMKDMLTSIKVISVISTMYTNIKKDTDEIVSDSKKILEIISLIKTTTTDCQAYKILMDNISFLTITINKILTDQHYIIKLISLFNPDIINDREKLEEYKDIFSFSKVNVTGAIRCFSDITLQGVPRITNKYVEFLKKLLSNIVIFQTSGVKPLQFIYIFSRLVSIIYREVQTNPTIHKLLTDLLEAIKSKISIEDLKLRKVNNLQGLISEITTNREVYRELLISQYFQHKATILSVFEDIIHRYSIEYKQGTIDIGYIFDFIQDNYISKL